MAPVVRNKQSVASAHSGTWGIHIRILSRGSRRLEILSLHVCLLTELVLTIVSLTTTGSFTEVTFTLIKRDCQEEDGGQHGELHGLPGIRLALVRGGQEARTRSSIRRRNQNLFHRTRPAGWHRQALQGDHSPEEEGWACCRCLCAPFAFTNFAFR